MFKTTIIVFALIIGGMLLFHMSLQNGSFLRFLDEHPDPRWVPQTAYMVGQGYYLFHDLQEASTYFVRIAQRYPTVPLADDAYFNYLQTIDDLASVPRQDLSEAYQAYLERYPNGKHVEVVKNRIDSIRLNSR